MGDIAQRGNRLTFAKGGRAAFKTGRRVGHKRNTSRENRLEELGRVDAEKAWTRHGKRDLRLEKHRIRKELKHLEATGQAEELKNYKGKGTGSWYKKGFK